MKRKREESKPRDEVLVLNIGGQKFTLHRDSILAQPETRLGKMLKEGRLKANHEDNIHKRQYYFERSPQFFNLVHRFYRDGTLPLSDMDVNVCDIWNELAYWEINFPPRLGKMVDFFMDKKENVQRYFDGLLDSYENITILHLQSFPPELPLYYGDGKLKKMNQEPSYENMTNDLYSLLERMVPSMDINGLTLKKYANTKFMLPFKDAINKKYKHDEEILHPILLRLYWSVIENWDELWNVVKGIFPTPLVEIMNDYLYGEYIDEEYLRVTNALYSMIIDGAALFDNDKDPSCSFARQHATRYLDKKGIKSNWKKIKVDCDLTYYTFYPLSFKDFEIEPFYKCIDYIPKHSGNDEFSGHSKCFSVWHLRFECPL